MTTKRKLLITGAVAAAAASGGAAYGATQSGSNPRQAYLNDVAHRLNVTPARLDAAMKAALLDRIDAAVKAGRLTQAEANRIKHRIEHGELPFRGPGGPPGFEGPGRFGHEGPHGPLAAAARYLGLSEIQLIGQLRSAKSLAQVAQSKNKSVPGLEQAMVAAARVQLDRLTSRGLITKDQEQRILNRLPKRIDRLVHRTRPPGHPLPPPGGPPGPAGGPPGPPPPGV